MSKMTMIEPPITTTFFPGGMCGPEGSASNESFWRRRKVTLTVYLQEESLEVYRSDEDMCAEFCETLGPVLHAALKNDKGPRDAES